MPLWKIYTTPDTLSSPSTRAALAQAITDYYTTATSMPAFYVGVIFLPLPDNALFIGGQRKSPSGKRVVHAVAIKPCCHLPPSLVNVNSGHTAEFVRQGQIKPSAGSPSALVKRPLNVHSDNSTARSSTTPFVRIEVEQIHIRLPDEDAAYRRNLEGLCVMLKPFLEGVGWEIHVNQTDRRLWAIDGIAPPEWRSEVEGRWREAGKALPRL